MRIWFEAWNAGNRRARRAYDERCFEMEARDSGKVFRAPPEFCKSGKHKLAETGVVWNDRRRTWRCKACRNDADRKKRRARGIPAGKNRRKQDAGQIAEITRRYAAGETTISLAAEYGTYPVTIARLVRAGGGQLRTQSQAMIQYHRNLAQSKQPGGNAA